MSVLPCTPVTRMRAPAGTSGPLSAQSMPPTRRVPFPAASGFHSVYSRPTSSCGFDAGLAAAAAGGAGALAAAGTAAGGDLTAGAGVVVAVGPETRMGPICVGRGGGFVEAAGARAFTFGCGAGAACGCCGLMFSGFGAGGRAGAAVAATVAGETAACGAAGATGGGGGGTADAAATGISGLGAGAIGGGGGTTGAGAGPGGQPVLRPRLEVPEWPQRDPPSQQPGDGQCASRWRIRPSAPRTLPPGCRGRSRGQVAERRGSAVRRTKQLRRGWQRSRRP